MADDREYGLTLENTVLCRYCRVSPFATLKIRKANVRDELTGPWPDVQKKFAERFKDGWWATHSPNLIYPDGTIISSKRLKPGVALHAYITPYRSRCFQVRMCHEYMSRILLEQVHATDDCAMIAVSVPASLQPLPYLQMFARQFWRALYKKGFCPSRRKEDVDGNAENDDE